MTQRDRDRLVALKKAKKGLITQRQAAEEIGQSERHVRRLLKRLSRNFSRLAPNSPVFWGFWGAVAFSGGMKGGSVWKFGNTSNVGPEDLFKADVDGRFDLSLRERASATEPGRIRWPWLWSVNGPVRARCCVAQIASPLGRPRLRLW